MILKIAVRHIVSKPLMTFFTLAALASTLTILGAFWTVVENLDRVRLNQSSGPAMSAAVRAGVTLFVDSRAPETESAALKTKLTSDVRFSKVEVIDSQEALKSLESQFGETLGQAFKGESLPQTYRLTFTDEDMNRDAYVGLLNELRTYPNVLDVDDGTTVSTVRKTALSSKVFSWASGLLVMIFVIVALLVSHLIRLAFESLKGEVETMKILGASKFWIFKPLLLEGVFFGIVGALASLLILSVGVKWVLPQFAVMYLPKGTEVHALSFSSSMGLLMLGLLASVVGAFFTYPLVAKSPKEI